MKQPGESEAERRPGTDLEDHACSMTCFVVFYQEKEIIGPAPVTLSTNQEGSLHHPAAGETED